MANYSQSEHGQVKAASILVWATSKWRISNVQRTNQWQLAEWWETDGEAILWDTAMQSIRTVRIDAAVPSLQSRPVYNQIKQKFGSWGMENIYNI